MSPLRVQGRHWFYQIDSQVRFALGHKKIYAMSRLCWCGRYLAAARNTLVGRQRSARLDLPDEQIKGALGVRLDQFERRERIFVRLDMVSVLHLVQPVSGWEISASIPLVAFVKRSNGRDVARVGAGVMIDRQ